MRAWDRAFDITAAVGAHLLAGASIAVHLVTYPPVLLGTALFAPIAHHAMATAEAMGEELAARRAAEQAALTRGTAA